ncbi:MAG: hypothetical protein IJ728_13465 [Selenomonadaceae bacterium]|nr:hypothetical protein [Selenomonadaceae bacterium]
MENEIKIDGLKYDRLIDLQIFERVNQHSTCTIIVDSSVDPLTLFDQKLTIKMDQPLFVGIVDNVSKAEYLTINLIGMSAKLDIEIHRRAFFKKNLSDILKKIAENYSINIEADFDGEISIVQNSTDWEFLKIFGDVFTSSSKPLINLTNKIGDRSSLKVISNFIEFPLPFATDEISIDFHSPPIKNPFKKFQYLIGSVLESKDNNIKVKFEDDENQSDNESIEIPYSSAASNYLYTMPDKDDKIFVHFDGVKQEAMGSLRKKDPSDPYDKRSFKIKDASLSVESDKMEFAAAKDKAVINEGAEIKLTAKKDIIFSSKGDMIIQSAAGMLPDNQIIMAAAHMAGYAQYLAMMGQPATVQLNPAGSTVGKLDSQIKNAGSKAEAVELSDIAKELDKISGRKSKSEKKSSGGGGGGSIKFNAKDSLILQVKDSSISMKGKNLNVKTRALMQVGYIPTPGGGTGSLSKFEGGNPNNRSDKINIEHGSEDRSRVKEKITPVDDNKNISR